jgi:hypothetical protein
MRRPGALTQRRLSVSRRRAQELADRIGARLLDADPVGAAALLTARDDPQG